MTAITPKYYSAILKNMFWLRPVQNHFIFRTSACSDAHVYLSSGIFESIDYTIEIGSVGNSKILVKDNRNGAREVANVDFLGVLDCYRDQEFWITWADSELQFGRGHTFENRLFQWTVPDYQDIQSLSLSVRRSSQTEFKFDARQGKC